MATDKTQEDEKEILKEVKEFLQESSDYYANLIKRKKRDMEIFSGNFWTPEVRNEMDRTKRVCKTWTQYPKYVNAIVSPFSKSPYKAQIEDHDGTYIKIQEQLDKICNRFDAKKIILDALRMACITGTGFYTLTFGENNEIIPELVRDVSQVALDPFIQSLSGEDAEKGAIVNFISMDKAKRLYGDDIVSLDGNYFLSDFGDQWQTPTNSIAVVSYYRMNDNGQVNFYKLCGNLVVEGPIELPIDRIPIFRTCFNEVTREDKIDYIGIVDLTSNLQYALNVGYSTLIERMNRTPKANFMMPVGAMDGLDEYYKKLQTKESIVALYKGSVPPTQITEAFQTQDLMNTIDTTNNLMAQTIGVPIGGINPAMNSQTATEVLVQQNNSESNMNSLYENASACARSFNKSLIYVLSYLADIEDKEPEFKLIDGPEIITQNMKKRQELVAVSTLVDANTKQIIAKHYIDTLDADLAKPLNADLVANLPTNINLVSDNSQQEDPRAVHVLNQMNAVLQQTQQQLQDQVAKNAALQKTIDQMNLELINQREQRNQDFVKFQLQMKNDNQMKILDMQNKNDMKAADLTLESKKLQDQNTTDMAKVQADLVKEQAQDNLAMKQMQVDAMQNSSDTMARSLGNKNFTDNLKELGYQQGYTQGNNG